MKRLLSITMLFSFLMLIGCKKEKQIVPDSTNKVLMLKVDYLTNTFEGGHEFSFSKATSTFTIKNEYKPASDFGYIKLWYDEVTEPLFHGSIIWMGKGQINFPQNLLPADNFQHDSLANIIGPGAGFENLFNPQNQTYNYSPVWLAVQGLTKVRAYLKSNPNATVKLFLYTPSVGIGNPAEWDWIVFLKT